jgi:phenylalanyl-tRNA synthetase beta chain
MDYYDLKGKIEILLKFLGPFGWSRICASCSSHIPSWQNGYFEARFMLKQGIMGEIHPKVAENYQLEERVIVAELDLDILLDMAKEQRRYRPLPKYPAVTRDLALGGQQRDILAGQVETLHTGVWGRAA